MADDPRPQSLQQAREAWARVAMARRTAVLGELVARVEGGGEGGEDEEETALGWLAVERQARCSLRQVSRWGRARSGSGEQGRAAHVAALEDWVERARAELGGTDPAAERRARSRLGLRVAVIGKGGAGKSVVSATLARLLARRGRRVLAADLDTNPGLAYSLGLGAAGAGFPPEAVEPHQGAAYGWQLASGLDAEKAVERFATPGPDGVRCLSLGKIDEPDKAAAKRSVVAMTQVLGGLGDPSWDVVGDLEAGPTTPFEGYHGFADRVLVVVGPAWRSALTARRLLALVGEVPVTVVANRFGDQPDHAGLASGVRIPFDPAVSRAERLGVAPMDHCPASPAVRAVGALATTLVDQLGDPQVALRP